MSYREGPNLGGTFVTGIFLLTISLSAFGEMPRVTVDHLVVYKHERRLVLLSHGQELKSYQIALGGEPTGPKVCTYSIRETRTVTFTKHFISPIQARKISLRLRN